MTTSTYGKGGGGYGGDGYGDGHGKGKDTVLYSVILSTILQEATMDMAEIIRAVDMVVISISKYIIFPICDMF